MSETFQNAVAGALLAVTKDWAAIKKKRQRDRRRAERDCERYFSGRSLRVTVKDAAYEVMADAYMNASGGGRYPANARQVMYAARGAIQEQTGRPLDDDYFTQRLLPDYENERPEETADWDVVYDARGHLLEPHTGREIGLGTVAVREYLNGMEEPVDTGIPQPHLDGGFPTVGPANRYGAILYIEKEGFGPLLQQARFAERYDLAIMSSKGMGTTAARTLIERLSGSATIFVLHDFDKAGFSIVGTLTRDTRRYEYITTPEIVDLGLRLGDVQKWNLQSEDVDYGKSNPKWNLIENGATADEIQFLCDQARSDWGHYRGKRVELNAFTSDQFVKWLDSKLKQHRVKKVIPGKAILEQAYRRAAALRQYQKIIDRAREEILSYAERLRVPEDLDRRLAQGLRQKPTQSWDQALGRLLDRND